MAWDIDDREEIPFANRNARWGGSSKARRPVDAVRASSPKHRPPSSKPGARVVVFFGANADLTSLAYSHL